MSESETVEVVFMECATNQKSLIDGGIYLLKTYAPAHFPEEQFKIGRFLMETPTRWHGLQPSFYINSLEGYLSPSKVKKFALLKAPTQPQEES